MSSNTQNKRRALRSNAPAESSPAAPAPAPSKKPKKSENKKLGKVWVVRHSPSFYPDTQSFSSQPSLRVWSSTLVIDTSIFPSLSVLILGVPRGWPLQRVHYRQRRTVWHRLTIMGKFFFRFLFFRPSKRGRQLSLASGRFRQLSSVSV